MQILIHDILRSVVEYSMEISRHPIDAAQPDNIIPELQLYIIGFWAFQSLRSIVDIYNKSVKCLKPALALLA